MNYWSLKAQKQAFLFLTGIAAGLALPIIMEAQPLRKAITASVAASLRLRERAEKAFETIMEEAENLNSECDCCCDDDIVEEMFDETEDEISIDGEAEVGEEAAIIIEEEIADGGIDEVINEASDITAKAFFEDEADDSDEEA
ncbi:MAG: hypothetical protein FWG30_04370 [Eubacteriaceae bacterium]|nr:hypothetical protein [Eubacteriaceae bacterium]